MPTPESYTIRIERHGAQLVAWVEELPGANTQGRTLAETLSNVADAITLFKDEPRERVEAYRCACMECACSGAAHKRGALCEDCEDDVHNGVIPPG